jgi:hypothetical protein
MNHSEAQEIARHWIKLCHLPSNAPERDSSFWAYSRLSEATDNDPESAWQIIGLIYELEPSDIILANVAAGPLEDLLTKHGRSFIDRIESLAVQNPVFRRLLGAVWKNQIAEDIWVRI